MCNISMLCNYYKDGYIKLLKHISSIWPEQYRDRELQYRQNEIEMALKKSKNEGHFAQEFYSITHEIRCLRFLQLSSVEFTSALDCNNEAGADIRYYSAADGRKINIECTICTYGETPYEKQISDADGRVMKFTNGEIVTGKRESFEAIDIRRMTQRIKAKRESKQNVEHEPFIIWLGAGELADKCVFGSNGERLLDILFGMKILEIDYSKDPPQLSYSLKMKIQKKNDPEN